MTFSDQSLIGKIGENAWNSRLAEALRDKGFPSTEFELLFPTLRGLRKPDVSFNGGHGLVLISGKLGERQEVEAIVTAQEYQQTISKVSTVQEAIAVTYPAKQGEQFRLRALATTQHDSFPWTCRSLQETVEKIVNLANQDWAKAQLGLESSVSAAIRVLRAGVIEYSSKLTKAHLSAVEQVFGGEEFFDSILGYEEAEKTKNRVMKAAAAYLFLNQVMFYEILAQETRKYPSIAESDYSKPTCLKPRYFDLVLKRDYRPIFAFDVAGSLTDKRVGEASARIIRAVRALFPGKVDHDIVGKIFHNLIPLELRKLVAAYFTNIQAGDLLARVSIDSFSAKVLDPACGSGTLLVSCYKAKSKLAGGVTPALHRQFVEEDITGTDIMAFSAHLAAVNLALQAPLFETDNVRVAIADSTSLVIGSEIEQAREVFKEAFRSRRLEEFVEGKFQGKPHERSKAGVVSIGNKEQQTMRVEPVDLVIMNPPFTNCDNLPSSYKEELQKRFSSPKEHGACIHGKLSFQAYFLLLADRLLKPEGRLACVLPVTTFSGKAFAATISLLLDRYTVTAIVTGLGRSAFSENTSLSEILLLARRGKAPPRHHFILLGVKKAPTEWSEDEVEELAAAIEKHTAKETPLYITRLCPQEELAIGSKGLTALLTELSPSIRSAHKLLERLLTSENVFPFSEVLSSLGAIPFAYEMGNPDKFSNQYGRGSKYFGFSALFVINSLSRMKKKSDYLVLERKNSSLIARNRYDNSTWEIPGHVVKPCIRRLTGVTRIDFTERQDYVIAEYYKGLPRMLRNIYPEKEATFYEGRIKEEWSNKVEHGMSNLCVARRIDFGAKGTNLLAVYNDNLMLLAANSWGFRNLTAQHAKVLTLWFNSTIFFLTFLANRMQTRGTFGQIDRRQLTSLKCLAFSKLHEDQMAHLVDLFDKLKGTDFPSIKEQLETDFEGRVAIDDAFMGILGLRSESERANLGKTLRKAASDQIGVLQRAMSGD
jgi:hypothetical protein